MPRSTESIDMYISPRKTLIDARLLQQRASVVVTLAAIEEFRIPALLVLRELAKRPVVSISPGPPWSPQRASPNPW
jgi:hypothetical protein